MERKKNLRKGILLILCFWNIHGLPGLTAESLRLIYISRFPGVIPLQGHRADKAELMTFQSERSSDRLSHEWCIPVDRKAHVKAQAGSCGTLCVAFLKVF